MKKTAELDEDNIKFFEAVGLVVMIKERKMTLKSFRAEVSECVISILKKLEWITAEDEGSEIRITAPAQKCIIEYQSMIVLENIRNRVEIGNDERGMKKADLESNAPCGVVDFLTKNKLVVFKGMDWNQIVYITEKGEEELEEYFKKEE